MRPLTNYQTIKDESGKPTFVVIPYADFVHSQGYVPKDSVPHAVVSKAVDGQTMLQAWREYLMLTQEEMAKRMGITQAGYAQIESAKPTPQSNAGKSSRSYGY